MTTKLKCYYEVLGIEKIAKPDEIKIAYRKLALIWHPDKNQDRLPIAEEKFKELNNAYTVLSDPNERKWYDDHKDAILRGGRGGNDDDDDDDDINLWPFFNSSCFKSYNDDDEMGFYKVYERIFNMIDKEEEGEEDINEYHYQPAKFGNSKSPIDQVLKFYSYWKDFITKKRFTQADLYHLSDAPNRQIKRIMEKENQKERNKAKQSYNEKVRHLATFIYNHDKRITEYQKKCLEESERKAKEQEEQRERDEKDRQEAIKKFKEEKKAEYEKSKKEGLYKDDQSNIYQDESTNNNSYCVICDKAFKSEGQLENHENSNKHKQEVIRIRKAVLMDDEFGDDDILIDDELTTTTSTTIKTTTSTTTTTTTGSSKKSKKQKKKSKKVINSNMFNNNSNEFVFGLVNKKKSKSKVVESESESEEEEEEEEVKVIEDDEDLSNSDGDDDELLVSSLLKNFTKINLKDKKKKEKETQEKEKEKEKEKDQNEDDDDEDEDEDDEIEYTIKKDINNNNNNEDDDDDSEEEEKPTKKPIKKPGKAKEKREKKAEKAINTSTSSNSSTHSDQPLYCNVCKNEFPTRNKLFQHIKDTNHAQAVPSSNKKKK